MKTFLRRIGHRQGRGDAHDRSLSLPALATAQQAAIAAQARKPQVAVPAALRKMDYNKVMDSFKLYDSSGRGRLDKAQFLRFMNAIEPMSREQAERVFDAVDVDRSGTVEAEELISWCFQTNHVYSGDVRDRLSSMPPEKIHAYLNSIDANGNGEIDRGEFFTFVKTFSPESNMTRAETDKLFSSIDTDRSGEIDTKEFMSWVYRTNSNKNGPRAAPPMNASPMKRSSSNGALRRSSVDQMAPLHVPDYRSGSQGTPGASPSLQRTKSNAAMLPPGKKQEPVVLEFTIGQDFEPTLRQIIIAFRKDFKDAIKVKTISDPSIKGCRRLVVLVGNGIVLWDRHTMITHMDDPFESFDSSKIWVYETMRERLPTLLKAVNLGK